MAKRRRRNQPLPGQNVLPWADVTTLAKYLAVFGHDKNFTPQCQPKPTKSEAGSRERVEEYARRIAEGEELWHPDDPKADLAKPSDLLAALGELAATSTFADPEIDAAVENRVPA